MSKTPVTAIILIYCSIFVASSIYVMIPLQPMLAEKFDVSLQLVSLSSTLFVFPYALGLVFFGLLADRFPLRKLLLIGMALLTVVTGLLSLTNAVHSLLILRIFQGILAASFAPVTFAYCFKYFKGSTQAFIIAMINTGFLFAGVFGQMTSAYFTALFSYQFVFVAFFCFYFSCFIGLFFTLRSSASEKNKQVKKILPMILSCVRDYTLQKIYSITFFLLLTIMLFYGSFEIYLYEEWPDFPYSIQLLRLISLIGILPAFLSSILIKRFGAKSVLQFQLGVMMIGFIPAVITLNVFTILFASLFMIASTSLTIPMVVLLVGKHAKLFKSTAVSLYSFVLLTGASAGSVIAPVIPFTTVLILIPAVFLLLSFLSRLLPSD
ncbi:MFS transporter [Paraliobacillus quinghaiensis]|uniref:MFS transporter n=1 Tax=Paraliobacillus quinghaiensis TaxID=470815 RepID=A0A917TYS8_9BACI|nr:MFS transporter [Paraliobacillus quinghaiensis]GGM42192.1 MFS transporter [Paraliobacillus quinghaiensis]